MGYILNLDDRNKLDLISVTASHTGMAMKVISVFFINSEFSISSKMLNQLFKVKVRVKCRRVMIVFKVG